MAAAVAAAAAASNSQYPFYIHPKIIINFDFVEYNKREGERVMGAGVRADSRI